MKTVKKEGFKIIGLKVRTTNENGQAAKDIPQLWGQFMSENSVEKIPNKIDSSVLSLYTNYESDHTKQYDTIIGCKVSTLDNIPEGMFGEEFKESTYAQVNVKGDLNAGIVYNAWTEIWKKDLDRTFIADFEIYGEKAQNPADAEVEIFVGLK